MPKKYSIKLLPSARRDLFEIAAYISTDSKRTAIKYINKVQSKLKSLSSHPDIGRIPKDEYLKKKGYRILVIDNYLVFYVIKKSSVNIRRILHGSRDIKSVLF